MKLIALLGLCVVSAGLPAFAATPATHRVAAGTQGGSYTATGTIEAVRQGTLGAQLSGRVLDVLVHAGDEVRAGQPLIRIEADEAEAEAATAAASGARTRAAWRTVIAPYAGHVTELFVTAGDLATPGRPLIALYDPAALRVTARIPASVAAQLQGDRQATVIVEPGQQPIRATAWKAVSAVDPATHSVEVRVELPAGTPLRPGEFVQVLLPLKASTAQLRIPARAVLRRSEVTAVYVIDSAGAAHLRQVRLGRVEGDEVTVLAGLEDGELVALDPLAAGRP